jgi:hypothetical protein
MRVMYAPEIPGRIIAQRAINPVRNRIGYECPRDEGLSMTIPSPRTIPIMRKIKLPG